MTIRTICSLAFAVAMCTVAPFPSFAEEVAPDRAIIVTATRQPTSAEVLPYTVTVLDPAALVRTESIADAVSNLPEVYVQMPGGRSGFGSLFLRGADPNFTSVLLEGIPLDSPTNSRGGSVNLSEFPSVSIDRAELLSGPASTLYGSGSLAGAVNLLLGEPTRQHRLILRASAGTEKERLLSGRWQGPLTQGLGGSVTMVADDAGTGQPFSRFSSQSINALFAPLGTGRGGLVLHIADVKSQGFPDSSGGFLLAERRMVERRRSKELIVGIDQSVIQLGAINLDLAASYFLRKDWVSSPGVAASIANTSGVPGGTDNIRYSRIIIRPSASVKLPVGSLTFGFQAQTEEAHSQGLLDLGFLIPTSYRQNRQVYSAYAEIAASLNSLEINAGLRSDDIEGIGHRTTGRAGVKYLLTPNFSLHANLGSAFKAPSFYAVANPFIGNPNLKPETATAGELGLIWRWGSGNLFSLIYFRSLYRNLIDFVPSDPPRLENRDQVSSKGVSAMVSGQPFRNLSMSIAMQFVETKDTATSTFLLNRPRFRLSSEVLWQAAPSITFDARLNFTSKRDDFSVPTGINTLGTSYRSSLSAIFAPRANMELRFDAENLLGNKSQEAIGFPALPRRVRLGIVYRL